MPLSRVIGEPLPEIAGKYSGSLHIIGGGRNVWEDIENNKPTGDVMAINDVGMYWPKALVHWYSNHAPHLPIWAQARTFRKGMKDNPVQHLHSCYEGVKWRWPFGGTGTSSLNAVYVALGLGYAPIVLCGIPLDDSGNFFDPHWVRSNFRREAHYDVWEFARDQVFDGKVKSMSGMSRQMLGAP